MFRSRRLLGIWVLIVVGVGVGGTLVSNAEPPASKDEANKAIRKLLTERRDVLRQLVQVQFEEYRVGKTDLRAIVDARRQLLSVQLELKTGRAERVKLLTDFLALEKEVEAVVRKRHQVGAVGMSDVLQAHALRLDIETQLLRAKHR